MPDLHLVNTSHYSRLEKPTIYRLPPKKDYHVYITRIIYHYAYARQTQVNSKKETTNKYGEKGKEIREKKAKKKNEVGKREKRQDKKSKKGTTRRGSKERKSKKNVILADPRN